MSSVDLLISRVEKLVERIEGLMPYSSAKIDFDNFCAFKWIGAKSYQRGYLKGISSVSEITFDLLANVDDSIQIIKNNTQQFLKDYPCNNVLLTGSRGAGKSSIIKACLNEYKDAGLKMIEINQEHLNDLEELIFMIIDQPYKFIIFCDDISFEADNHSYKPLKSILDGSLMERPKNVLFYVTSNRRHLVQEKMSDNTGGSEIHPMDAVDEKISLSERFGIWINFYKLSQTEYLNVIEKHLLFYNLSIDENLKKEALQYAMMRGSRSGRIAEQFVKQLIGEKQLTNDLQSNR